MVDVKTLLKFGMWCTVVVDMVDVEVIVVVDVVDVEVIVVVVVVVVNVMSVILMGVLMDVILAM